MYRVSPDGYIETDSAAEAIELSRQLRTTTAIVVRGPQINYANPLKGVATKKNGVSKTKDGLVYDEALVGGAPFVEDDAPGIPEDNVKILLQAAGYKNVKKAVRSVYGLMLRDPKKVWGIDELAERTKRTNAAAGHVLAGLFRRGAVKRHGIGQYQIA